MFMANPVTTLALGRKQEMLVEIMEIEEEEPQNCLHARLPASQLSAPQCNQTRWTLSHLT